MKVGDYTSQQYKRHKVEESDGAGDLPDIRRFYESGADDTTQGTHDPATSSTRLLKA